MNYFHKIRNLFMAAVIFVPAAVSAQEVRISQGANIIANGDVKIILREASMVNNGSFIAGSSSVLFTGNASKQRTFIGGGSRTEFYNLSINRPFGLVQLDNNISVSGKLTLNAGNLELNNHRLDLGSTGVIIGENINARITGVWGGVIIAKTILNAPEKVNPGNIGLELSSQANLGSVVITRGHVRQVNLSGQTGINRYYEIEASNSNAQASLRFFYLDPEVADINESDLALWTGNTFMSWVATGKEHNDAGNNWVAKNNLSLAKKFTLGISERGLAEAMGMKGKADRRADLISVQAFPNPASNRFTVVFYNDVEKKGTVSLQDQRGRVLERKPLQYVKGVNTIQWNITRYAAGTYYVVFDGMEVGNVKVVKQ